MYKKTR